MKTLNSEKSKGKRSLAELLEEDKHRKLIPAEHEEKFFISTEDQRNFDDEWKKNGSFGQDLNFFTHTILCLNLENNLS